MKFQSRKFSCGPAALHNAIEPLGIDRSEDELATLAGTTTEGTNETGLKKAAKALGLTVKPVSEKRYDIARLKLFEHVYNHGTALLCVDEYSHWVAVVGLSAKRFIIIDSADNNLVVFWDEEKLEEKWSGSGNYYGILLIKAP